MVDPCQGLEGWPRIVCIISDLKQFPGRESETMSFWALEELPNELHSLPLEEVALRLAQTAKGRGRYPEAAWLSQALSDHLLQSPQQTTDLLVQSIIIQQEVLLELRRHLDATILNALKEGPNVANASPATK